ncbi:DUF4142 domain-containing protein [Pseudomonas sp. X10]
MKPSLFRPATLALGLALLISGPAYAAATDGTFVSEAASAGMAEIQTSQLALTKSDTPAVRAFAQRMIDDHTKANLALLDLAQAHGFEVPDNAALTSKARSMALQVQDGASFDSAYARHQVNAHEQAIQLFEEQGRSPNAEESIRLYARDTLPMLKHHLEMARQLQDELPTDDDGARQP